MPYTFIGSVSETGNFIAVATFSGVNASYGVRWLGAAVLNGTESYRMEGG